LKRATAFLLAVAVAGCATSAAFRAGERAERRRDFDRAVLEYSKALQARPDDLDVRKALDRAKLRASQEHTTSGRRLLNRGLYKEALDELKLALDLNPTSSTLPREIQEAEARRSAASAPTSLEDVKDRARERSLPGLALGPSAREPLGLTFRGASAREVYQALGRAAGVNFVFDPDFSEQTVSLDLREVPFEQALNALANVAHTFHRVLDSRVVMVVPDTPNKRREYEQQVVKTFFLSNADLRETIDLLRIVLGARRVAPLPGANALTINDTPDRVAAAERIVSIVDKERSEVMVEVEILEVNRTKLNEYGIEITSGLAGQGIAGAVFPRETITETVTDSAGNPVFDRQRPLTVDDNPYKASNLLVTALPGVIYRLLRTDTSSRLLANPQLRAAEGATATARFGDQIPVPVTTFSPIATGGVAQQPVTSFEYKNVGVNIDITPRVHHDGEVTLTLKLEISSVGPLFQNLPTFNNRTVTSVIRLKDGETNILAGLINDSERHSLTGLPGLANVPLLGRLFARNRDEAQQTDIVMTLTPHVLRRAQLTEEDLRSFTVGGETTPLVFEVPPIPPITPAVRPSPEGPRVEPIRPPNPSPAPSPVT
jgi:general secretion pathway protein D